jgi:hypothetical protein
LHVTVDDGARCAEALLNVGVPRDELGDPHRIGHPRIRTDRPDWTAITPEIGFYEHLFRPNDQRRNGHFHHRARIVDNAQIEEVLKPLHFLRRGHKKRVTAVFHEERRHESFLAKRVMWRDYGDRRIRRKHVTIEGGQRPPAHPPARGTGVHGRIGDIKDLFRVGVTRIDPAVRFVPLPTEKPFIICLVGFADR